MAERLMTVEEFAERIGVCRTAAYEIVAKRLIDWVDTSSTGRRERPRIPESALDRYIKANLHKADAA